MAEARGGVRKMSCVLALLLFASVAAAQNPPVPIGGTVATDPHAAAPQAAAPTASASPTPEKKTPASPKISYAGGQLRIEALDSTLTDLLTRVAALTGVKIDIPAGAGSDPMPVVKLGPGPARQILASLLSRSSCDYVILASATDPEGIQKVVLVPREKRGSGGNGADQMARLSRIPDPRIKATPSSSEETPEPNTPAPAPADNTVAQASASTPAPTPADQPLQPETSTPTQSSLTAAALSNKSGLTTEGAMSPPASLDSQSINQQLLQMYQQRTQITQQQRQSVPPSTPSSPGNP